MPKEGSPTVVRQLDPDVLILFQLGYDGGLRSASGLGPGNAVAKDVRLAEMLIERGLRPDPAALADPATNLKKLLRD